MPRTLIPAAAATLSYFWWLSFGSYLELELTSNVSLPLACLMPSGMVMVLVNMVMEYEDDTEEIASELKKKLRRRERDDILSLRDPFIHAVRVLISDQVFKRASFSNYSTFMMQRQDWMIRIQMQHNWRHR